MPSTSTKQIPIENIQMAAFLRLQNIPLLKAERSGRWGIFYFPENKAEKLIQQFVLGKALVEPRSYSAIIRELRALTDSLKPARAGDSIG